MGTAGIRRALLLLAGVLAVSAPAGAANRLAAESSPYLLQHADNPVDWYPWGEEAFARAAAEDKPVFLSIGYSTCHWCHVMERESFADPDVAALLNAAFVCVKVDREERPDLDAFYMAVCQMMTGSGGWPLTLLLTPDRKPFFAATYLPKTARFGHTGLVDLVPRIRQLWTEDREEILRASDRILDGLEGMTPEAGESAPGPDLLERAFRSLKASFDNERGGFGGAPKFPPVHALRFLLRHHERNGSPEALAMVRRTLDAMGDGGIHDHLGGGFHRYSTDAGWRVPHFEKMLTDQALLALAYTEAWQVTGEPSYRAVAEGTLEYVLRDLAHPAGGLYSAEDADSEGEEGLFYLWTRVEVLQVLGKREGEAFCRAMGVEEGGNFTDPVEGARKGKNVLFRAEGAYLTGKKWERARRELLEARGRRVRPHRDGKVLADWNGLAIAALARAGRAFGEARYTRAAGRAAEFVDRDLAGPDGRLLHRWAAGRAGIDAFLDDHAFLALGRLELYAATWDPTHLRRALELAEVLVSRFGDPGDGGFFLAPAGPGAPPVRTKELFDGAVPSGHAVAVEVLLRLSALMGRSDLAERAWAAAQFAGPSAERYPAGHAHLLSALDLGFGPAAEVVVVGKPGARDTGSLLGELASGFHPSVTVLFKPHSGDPSLEALAPYTAPMEMLDGKATAYVCRGGSCDLPVTGVAAMQEKIQAVLHP